MGVRKWLNPHHYFGVERSQSLNFLWIFLMCLILIESALECQKIRLYMPAVEIGRRHLIHSLHAAECHPFSVFVSCFQMFPYFGSIALSSVQRWLRCFHVVAALDVASACDGRYSEHNGFLCRRSRMPLHINTMKQATWYQHVSTRGYQWISRFHKIPGSQLNFIAFPVHALSSSFSSGHAVSKQLGSGSCWGVPAPAHCRCAGGASFWTTTFGVTGGVGIKWWEQVFGGDMQAMSQNSSEANIC